MSDTTPVTADEPAEQPDPAATRVAPEKKVGLWKSMRRSLIWKMLGHQKPWVVATIFLFIGVAIGNLVLAQVTVAMVDQAIVAQTVPLGPFIGQLLFIAAALMVVSYVNQIVSERLSYHMEYEIRTWLHQAVHTADPGRLNSLDSGQLLTRSLTDLHFLEVFLRFVPSLIGIIPVFFGFGIYMITVNPIMAVFSMAGLPINIWLVTKFKDKLWALSFAELNERGEVTAAIDEPVRGIRVVRAFGREDQERERVRKVARNTYKYAITRERMLARYDIPVRAIPVLLQAALLFAGARLVRGGSLTLGTLLFAFQISAYTVLVGNMVTRIASLIQYLRSAQQRIGEVLGLEDTEMQKGLDLPEPSTGLSIENVSIAFDDRDVLTDVTFTVGAGELLVVTGSPSSGKSTLAGIASGAIAPDNGTVVLDVVDVRDLAPSELRRGIRVAYEEPYLFAESIRDNLELSVPDHAPEEDLWKALRAAHIDDYVELQPEGLDMELGDRGLTLSGGQRQRIGLARALVDPPRVLMMDDALSAVNPSLEIEILQTIQREYPDTAIVFASRRHSAASIATRVYALPDPDYADIRPQEAPPAVAFDALTGEAHSVVDSMQLAKDEPEATDADATISTRLRPVEIVRPFTRIAIIALVILCGQTLLQFAPEVFVGEVADVLEDPSSAPADIRAGTLAILGVTGALLAYGFRVMSQKFSHGGLYLLRRRVFNRLAMLGIDFYDRELPGEVATRVVHDLDQTQSFMQNRAFSFLTQLAQLIIGITLVMMYSTAVLPIIAGLIILLVGITFSQYPISTRLFNRVRTNVGEVTAKFEEDYVARDMIRGYGATQRQIDRFQKRSWELREARKWEVNINNIFGDLTRFLSEAAAALVLYRAGHLVLAGAISVGSVLTLRLLATTATSPVRSLASFYREVLNVRVSWTRLQQPFDVPILPVERPDAVPAKNLLGDISFNNVGFAYPHTGKQILHDIDFTIPGGGVASLVGYTGAGKSSIAKLLIRTYDPDQGSVTIGGRDIRDYQIDHFRHRIAVVPQDAFVFKGTIGSNIRYGKPDATDEEVEQAARDVSALEVLTSLPGGFDHPVVEDARNLTAAQRQLIALARAWINNPDILVLDEATSCLDARLEAQVLEAVGRLNCTTVMVTHRQNVVDASDLVVVIDDGRVVTQGDPVVLKGHDDAYDRLWATDPEAQAAPAKVGAGVGSNGRRRARTAPRSTNGTNGDSPRRPRRARPLKAPPES